MYNTSWSGMKLYTATKNGNTLAVNDHYMYSHFRFYGQ